MILNTFLYNFIRGLDLSNKTNYNLQKHTHGTYDWNTILNNNFDIINMTIKNNSNTSKPLRIYTFDGSFEPYHPSIKYFESGWNGYSFWMAYTPFPVSATPYVDRWECPSITVSTNGRDWIEPNIVNPLVDLTEGEINRKDYFSDPSLVMNGNTMEVWYRKTNGVNTSQTDIYRITSIDGVTWTSPQMVVDSQNASNGINKMMRSMQLFFDGTKYRSYWADGAISSTNRQFVFAETTNPSGKVWDNLTTCNLINAPKGSNSWHTGMFLDGSTYHLCSYDSVRKSVDYFKSTDGINFNFVKTILTPIGTIVNWYQTYPVKVGTGWFVYASMTKRGKHGITLLKGLEIENLIAIDDGIENNDL